MKGRRHKSPRPLKKQGTFLFHNISLRLRFSEIYFCSWFRVFGPPSYLNSQIYLNKQNIISLKSTSGTAHQIIFISRILDKYSFTGSHDLFLSRTFIRNATYQDMSRCSNFSSYSSAI